MILHLGERVYWGAPGVIYLEGIIIRLDEESQAVLVHIDRATPNSAHLIDTDVSFAADGLALLQGESPERLPWLCINNMETRSQHTRKKQ